MVTCHMCVGVGGQQGSIPTPATSVTAHFAPSVICHLRAPELVPQRTLASRGSMDRAKHPHHACLGHPDSCHSSEQLPSQGCYLQGCGVKSLGICFSEL